MNNNTVLVIITSVQNMYLMIIKHGSIIDTEDK